MMNIRRVEMQDLLTINDWFKYRKFPDMVKSLPSLGFIIEDDALKLAACFVYRDIDGRFCKIAWIVTSPGLPPRKSVEIIKQLVSHAEKELADMGFSVVLAVGKKGLGKLFSGLNWQFGSRNCNEYLKILTR